MYFLLFYTHTHTHTHLYTYIYLHNESDKMFLSRTEFEIIG